MVDISKMSETKKYILEGSNFNWDAFEKIFNSTSTPEVIQDLIEKIINMYKKY